MVRWAPDFKRYTHQSNCSNLICHSGRSSRVSAASLSDMTASQMRLYTAHTVIEPITSSISQKPLSCIDQQTRQYSRREGIMPLMLCQPSKPDWR